MKTLCLDGKTALVCGASQGIGRAVAKELANLGAHIVAFARNADSLQALIDELPDSSHHLYCACDLQKPEAVEKALTLALKKKGSIEIFIANSGGPKGGPVMESIETEYQEAFQAHILSNLQILRAILPGMKKRAYGRIIPIISTSVKAPIAGLGVSNTIRGAVASWSKTLSLELGVHGITVNNVLPGYTATSRLEQLIAQSAQKQGRTIYEIESDWKSKVPLGRFAQAEEVARVVAFLASPAASYVSGVSIPVDGGRTGSI